MDWSSTVIYFHLLMGILIHKAWVHELVRTIKPEMTGTYVALRATISFIVGLLIC